MMADYRFNLDLQYFAGEKTEPATPHKRQEGRKKGQIFKSLDLSTAISLLALFLYFRFAGGAITGDLMETLRGVYSMRFATSLTENNVADLFNALVIFTARSLAPLFLLALVVGVAAQLVQIGFLFHPEWIVFKPERIDPIKGLKRIYSLRAIVELIKSMLKILLIGCVAFSVIWINRNPIIETAGKSIVDGARTIGIIVVDMGIASSIALIVLSLLDFAYQKYDYEKNMRMSKQDIKDEYKNIEGDPLVRQRIRDQQKQMAMRRMMQELPKADVVITNPTHFAVALRYDSKTMEAPAVAAKGADYMAFRIKEAARKYEIPIVERKPLARALYFRLEIGDALPEEFFKVVAEILAYVYKQKGKV